MKGRNMLLDTNTYHVMMSKSNRLRAATATPKYVAFIVNVSNHLSAPPYLYKNLSTQ